MKSHLIALLVLAAFSCPMGAQETEDTSEKTIDSPSPNGRFAFRATHHPDEDPQKTYDLIDSKSGKVLRRVAESDDGNSRLGTRVLWARDSKRFALQPLWGGTLGLPADRRRLSQD